LFESREERDEFVPSPHSGVSRGEPQAKLLGAFSLDTFFGASKESINKDFKRLFCTPSLRAQRRGTPKKGHAPGVSGPPMADSLAGHMLAGTPWTRYRSDSMASWSALMHPSRLRSDGV